MSKRCILRLTENELCFIVTYDQMPTVRAEISQSHYFTEYTMNGVSEEQNEIYLDLDAVMFARSVGSLRMIAKSVKIKLTNKRQPCLTIEIELPSLNVESRHCIHDVPVRVVPRKEWGTLQVPNILQFDISVDMPQLRHVRNIVERMRNMDPTLTISADKTGTFVLAVDTDSATVSTHFQNLKVWNCSQQGSQRVSATIDARKFLMFLGWDTVHPDNVKCNILQDRMVNLFLDTANDLKIQYIIPALAT